MADMIPVLLLIIKPGDQEYSFVDPNGRSPRFLMEEVDGTRYFLPTREAADEFLDRLGIEPVSDQEMAEIRAGE